MSTVTTKGDPKWHNLGYYHGINGYSPRNPGKPGTGKFEQYKHGYELGQFVFNQTDKALGKF